MAVQRYFIYLAYDGTDYHGWQVQPNGTSIQQCLTDALSICLQDDVPIFGAGRTDTGVHAKLMVAHFDTEKEIDCLSLTKKLNGILPADISIYRILPVTQEAHARFSALSRTYKYYISFEKNPFKNKYSWQLHFPLDMALMNKAASLLLSCTDFTSFCKLHSDNKTNICHVKEAAWTKCGDNEWVFTITADRFLRNMVRAIVGTLIDVGRGKMNIDDFQNIITLRNRCKAGSSAPSSGLFLYDIAYPDNIIISDNGKVKEEEDER
jgi:tRNA pseudouridine38-40 synthase